jgi:hypothetical protein
LEQLTKQIANLSEDRNEIKAKWQAEKDVVDGIQAARLTLAGIRAGRLRVAYPWSLYAITRVMGALPPGWRNALMMRVPPKPQGA